MKLKNIFYLLLAVTLVSTSCKKKFDEPSPNPPTIGNNFIKIDSIYKLFTSYYVTSTVTPTKLYRFSGDVNLECVVTADESSGNIYKTAYVEDATGGLQIKLINAGGLYVGDKIRINLNNVVLNDYGNMVQLDSIDIEKRVVKVNTGNAVTATKMTFNQILAMNTGNICKYQSRLVILDSVEFSAVDKGQTFADAVNKYSIDRTLENSTGKTVLVRTSGYANFAGATVPCGKGKITAILTQYNSDVQLTIRDFAEVNMAAGGCPITLKTFEDLSLTNGGWTQYNVSGTINWTVALYSGNHYANISNYVSASNQTCETWLISPAFNLNSATNPRFAFSSAYNYTGPTLQVLVSTNYTSGDPTLATWTTLSPNLSTGGWNWAGSGQVYLASYKSANTRIAFKYTGTATSGSTWEVDNIAVYAD